MNISRSDRPTVLIKSLVMATAALLLSCVIVFLPRKPARTVENDALAGRSQDHAEVQGHPDLHFKYYHDIRASASGVNDYPTGYRTTEINRARAVAKTSGSILNWTERGPGNVGGRTRALLVDPDDPLQSWWAGAVSGGLWKTDDAGTSWKPVTDHLLNLAVSSLAMAASNPNIIYMGTGEAYFNLGGVVGDGIFKSEDRGETWEQLAWTAQSEDFRYVYRLAVNPANPYEILAATGTGIFRSINGGNSWTQALRSERVFDLKVQPGNFAMQIAAPYRQGILYSTDAGATWHNAAVHFSGGSKRIELAYSHADPDIAYGVVDADSGTEVLRSSDGGLSWAPTYNVDYDPDTGSYCTATNWLGNIGLYANAVAVRPFSRDTLFVGGIPAWRAVVLNRADSVSHPSALARGPSTAWLDFVDFGGSHFDGRLSYLDTRAVDVAETDYATMEIRFGQGTQKAHRFTVAEYAGTHSNGGEGVALEDHTYADYVEVPFQVWDIDANRQLMVSFRDQADDGAFNLIEYFTSTNAGTRDIQSFEHLFIHKYDYDAAAHGSIAQDGGMIHGMLYFMWPVLADGAVWDATALPTHTLTLRFVRYAARHRCMDKGFDTWNNLHVDHHAFLPIPIDEGSDQYWTLGANDGGVGISKDGGFLFTEFDQSVSGYNTSQFYGVAKMPGGHRYIGGMQDNGTYLSDANPTGTQAWQHVLGGDGFEAVWHARDPNKIMGSLQFSNIHRSLDGGATWNEVMAFDRSGGQFVTSIASSDLAPDTVYTSKKGGVWVSRDFGATWRLTGLPLLDGWGHFQGGCKVRASNADAAVVWAGCGLGFTGRLERRFFVSRDAGRSFDKSARPTINAVPNTYISGLATHPSKPGTAYGLFSRRGHSKVLETKNYGQSWKDLSGFADSHTGTSTNGFPDVAVHDLIVFPQAPNVLWVGTEIGLFQSIDYGGQWSYADNGLPAVSIWRMKIRDNQVIIGTHGRGIWTVPAIGSPISFSGIVSDQTYTQGRPIGDLVLPGAVGGVPSYTYALNPALPSGLAFRADTRTISGTPTAATAANSYTYAVTDAAGKGASLTFNIEVAAAVSFTQGVADQSFPRAQAITPLVLPEATGGAPSLVYSLAPALPDGLSFDPVTRILAGTPTVVTESTPFTYTAVDANGSRDSTVFSIKVYSPVDSEHESLPTMFALHGSYPNPTRNSARIVMDLPWPARVRVEVLDVAGRRVLSLPAADLAAGWKRSISLNTERLSAGFYLYQVHASSSQGHAVQKTEGFVRIR